MAGDYQATHRLMLVGRGKPSREGTLFTRNSDGKMIVAVDALPTVVLQAWPIRGKRAQVNVVLKDFNEDDAR